MTHRIHRIFAAICFLLGGCVAIPLPPTGPQIGPEKLATIKPGATTRAEIRALLGKPSILDHGRFLLTDVQKRDLNLLLILGGPGAAQMGILPVGLKHYLVLLKFDADERVEKVLFRSLNPPPHEDKDAVAPEGLALPDTMPTVDAPPLLKTYAGTVKKRVGWLIESMVERDRSFGSVAYAPSGDQIAIGTNAQGVLAIDLKTSRFRDFYAGESKDHLSSGRWVRAVSYSPDGKHLAAGGERTKVWDVASGAVVAEFHGHGKTSIFHLRNVTALAYAPGGKMIMSGDIQGGIKLWNSENGTELVTIRSDNDDGMVNALRFSADGRLLGSGQRLAVRLWDTATWQVLGERRYEPEYGKSSLAFCSNGSQIAILTETHIEIWQPKLRTQRNRAKTGPETPGAFGDLKQVLFLPRHKPALFWGDQPRIVFSPNCSTLAVSNGATALYHLPTGAITRSFAIGSSAVDFSPDGSNLITVGRKGIHLWDTSSVWNREKSLSAPLQ